MRTSHRKRWVALGVTLLAVCSAACQPVSPPATATLAATAIPATSVAVAPSATLPPSATDTETARPPTSTSPASATPRLPISTAAPQLVIARLSSSVAVDGLAHVYGEIRNVSAMPLSGIKLQLELPGHNPIDFVPALDVVAAGQAAPFDVPLPQGLAPLEAPKITITAYAPASVQTAALSVQAKQIDPGDGQIYLNGQMANDGEQPVQIYGLAAAELDQSGLVQGVGHDAAWVHYLAPGQRAPFSIILPGAQTDGEQWAIYSDARFSQPISQALTATITNAYLDECGCFRLAGLLSNHGGQTLSVPLVAAVYDAQGNLLQVQTISATLPVSPGTQLPFGVSFGASISSQIAAQRATVEVDLAGAREPASGEALPLPAVVIDMVQTQWELSFNSEVTNTSNQTLTGLDLIAAAYDKKGRLVAAEPLSISPADGGALAPGETFPLNDTLLLDGQAAPNSLKLVLLAQGRLR